MSWKALGFAKVDGEEAKAWKRVDETCGKDIDWDPR